MALKQQKVAGQVLVAIKKRCQPGVLDHTSLILNAPGASARTKLLAFVQFIEGRRLCDLSVVTVVQDDIRSLDPIISFADAVDNMIAINLLQEELLMMGQPYSDADLIIQHSNKMPNTENFRALKMEFIDCDVSQFSTSRPSLTHTQPNPQHLRVRKTWDEYCHRIQRFNASDPMNQPKSALSAKMDTGTPAEKVLAATTEPMEAMVRRILAEATAKPAESKRSFSQADQGPHKRGRQEQRPERPPYQDRQSHEQPRYFKPPQGPRTTFSQAQSSHRSQPAAHQQKRQSFQQYGPPGQTRQRNQERKAFSATEDQDYEEAQDLFDSSGRLVFSASKQLEDECHSEEEGEDRHAMMGRRDYDLEGPIDDDEDLA